jgi:hypothetical protein
MRWLKQWSPSPAISIALVALVVALAGTAMAGVATVSKLGKKERKEVTKIANKTANKRITKRAPKLSVRHAGSADVAANADSLGGAAASAYVQRSELTPVSETTLRLHLGWINIVNPEGPGPGPARAYRDQLGVVHLAGLVTRTAGSDGIALTLPLELRPRYDLEFPAVCDEPGLIFDPSPGFAFIDLDGDVHPVSGGSSSDCFERFSLDGIAFKAAG